MDWDRAIERNHGPLLRLAAMLVALVGVAGPVPASLRWRVLRLLRPAESAARRLIVVMAAALPRPEVAPPRRRGPRKPPPSAVARIRAGWGALRLTRMQVATWANLRRRADGGNLSEAQARAGLARLLGKELREPAVPAFRLIDPRKRFDHRARRAGVATPRISVPGLYEPPPPPPAPAADRPVAVEGIRRRVAALRAALDDLPAQAARLARYEARREAQLDQPPEARGRLRLGPLRGGWPPGHRMRPVHFVHEVLAELNRLAHVPRAPDTS